MSGETVLRRPVVPWAGGYVRVLETESWCVVGDEVVDLVAVERVVNGERLLLTRAERRYAAALLFGRGVPRSGVGELLGLSGRTAERWFREFSGV